MAERLEEEGDRMLQVGWIGWLLQVGWLIGWLVAPGKLARGSIILSVVK